MEVPDIPEATTQKVEAKEEITTENKKETPNMINNTEATKGTKNNKFVPLWMPMLAFAAIAAAYIYCGINDIPVNGYREAGALGISALFAILCTYMNNKD